MIFFTMLFSHFYPLDSNSNLIEIDTFVKEKIKSIPDITFSWIQGHKVVTNQKLKT